MFGTVIQVQEFTTVAGDYNYKLVSGSARKPNKQQREGSLLKMAQVMTPMWQQLLQMGLPDPYNAFMTEYVKSLEIEDYERFTVPTETLTAMMDQQKQEAQQQQQQQQEMELQQAQIESQKAQEDVLAEQRQNMQIDSAKAEQQLHYTGQQWQQKLQGQDAMTRLKMLEQLIGNAGSQQPAQ